MMTNKFPFTIRQVAKTLDLRIRYDNPDSGNMDIDCPFCQKESKMNLNAAKNVYRCNYCGEKGGMLELYGKMYGVSNADAYRELCEVWACNKDTNPADSSNPTPKQINRAASNTIHQTYSMLLSMLNLAKSHREQLLSRGLSQEQITEFNYKSVPAFGQQRLCTKLLQSGCTLEGVPGFFRENGEWNVKLKAPGILIPVRGIDGKIAGIQIRLDKPINNRKYIWFSSPDLDGGASSGAPVHFIGDPTAKRIFVTDGALKGAVAHILTGYTFVCLPGAKSLGGLNDLLLQLKSNGTTEALEAFNINKLTDKKAAESAAKLREKLSFYGFKVTSAIWSNESLNGVDDYYLQRIKEERSHVQPVALTPPKSLFSKVTSTMADIFPEQDADNLVAVG